MISNPLDRKLVPALKAVRKEGGKSGVTASKFREFRSRVLDAEVGRVLDEAFTEITTPTEAHVKPQPESAVGALRLLRDRGFTEVEAFLFEVWKEVLAGLPFEQVIALAGNAAGLETWRKATSFPTREFANRLLADPERTYATAGGDWLFLRGKPTSVVPLLELLLARRPRPKYLPGWAEAIEGALKKDNKGVRLDAMLRVSSENAGNMATLTEVVRLNPTLLKSVLENLPGLLSRKDAPTAGAAFLEQIFSSVSETDGDDRELLTATLARLGTGIVLSGRRNAASDAVLIVIANVARLLRNRTLDEAVAARTWVLENLLRRGEEASGRLQITLDGARDLALAFEKLAQGFNATEVLKVTAQNLGLKPIGSKGGSVTYDPLQHQDLDGGMLPGDPGVVEAGGWAHGRDVVLRAKIRKGVTHV